MGAELGGVHKRRFRGHVFVGERQAELEKEQVFAVELEVRESGRHRVQTENDSDLRANNGHHCHKNDPIE